MKKLTSLFLTALIIGLFSSVNFAQDLESYLAKADSLSDAFKFNEAVTVLEKANQKFPNNWKVLWRLSRENIYIGNATKDDDKREAIYEKAFALADQAVKAGPDQAVTYLRRAIANGKIALSKGVFSVGGIVNAARADLKKTIQLGNGGNYVQAVAHYVLGRTHAKVSEKWKPARSVLGLGWADLEVALKEYQKAIDLYPNFVMFYVDYAKAEMRNDNYEKAKQLLEKALTVPNKDVDDPKLKEEAKKLLKEVNEEL